MSNMQDKHQVALVKADYCRPSGMYAWEWVNANSLFQITVFVSEQSNFSYDDMSLEIIRLPMSDHTLTVSGHALAGLLQRFGLPIRHLKGLAGHLKNYDIVITVDDGALFGVACAAAKKNNRLVLYTDENIQCPPYRNHWGIKKTAKFVQSRVDRYFVTTPMTMRRFIYDGVAMDKISVVPYAIPVNLFFPSSKFPQVINLPERLKDQFVVLFTGRVCMEKGIPWLLNAARYLIPLYPDLNFVFVGKEDMPDDSFKEFLRDFEDKAFYLGVVDHRSLNSIYNLCDVLVLPSIPTSNWDEQFGMVLLEAMACGKPVIASHTGGIPYVLSPESSILVNFCSSEALSKAIVTLYLDRDRLALMGRNAHQFFQETYTDEIVGKQIVRELERLV